MSTAHDALRACHPNAEVEVRLGSARYGVVVSASTLVRDYDAMVADRDHYKTEAEKWERLALRLSDAITTEGTHP